MQPQKFKTFDSVWDETYDSVKDDTLRVLKLSELLKKLDQQTLNQKNEMFKQCIPIIEHNWNHFYRGDFADVLWIELVDMLNQIKT